MAAHAWPASLEQCWLLAGFQRQNDPVVIRSEVEAGIAKVRRRFTRAVIAVTAEMTATNAQVNTLDTFFNNTLQGGALRFSFTDPITNALQEYRFINPPLISIITEKVFLVSMELEQL